MNTASRGMRPIARMPVFVPHPISGLGSPFIINIVVRALRFQAEIRMSFRDVLHSTLLGNRCDESGEKTCRRDNGAYVADGDMSRSSSRAIERD